MKKKRIMNIILIVIALMAFGGAVSSQSETLPAALCGIITIITIAALVVHNVFEDK